MKVINALVILGVLMSVGISTVYAACKVTSYDDLRTTIASPGDRCTVAGGLIGGTFILVDADPYGDGDDDGVVINAQPTRGNGSNAWWVRTFPYSDSSPILLDWYQLKDGANVTTLLNKLARRYSPNLFIKVPSNSMSLILGYVELQKYGIRNLVIRESNSPIKFKSPSKVEDRMFYINDFDLIEIGGALKTITFEGIHKSPRDSLKYVRSTDPTKRSGSIVEAFRSNTKQLGNVSKFVFEANCSNSLMACLLVATQNMNNKTSSVLIKGNFANSGFQINGVNRANIDAYVSDPFVEGLGWDGTVLADGKGRNGYYLDNISDWPSLKIDKKFYSNGAKRAVFVHVDELSGRLELEYGATWFMSTLFQIGVSKEEPFYIGYKNSGFTGSGVRMDVTGFQGGAGKIDHLGPNPDNLPRYLKVAEEESKWGFAFFRDAVLEASSEDGNGGYVYFTEGVNLAVENVSATIETNTNYVGDYVRNNVISGKANPKQTVTINDGITVRDFVGYNIRVAYNVGMRSDDEKLKQPKNCLIEDSRIIDGGKISVDKGSKNTKIHNVQFEGSSRNVIYLQGSTLPGQVTELDIANVSAPRGSTITADTTGQFRFSIGGVPISLAQPFIFGTSDIDKDKVFDEVDNCVAVANPDQIDSNHDGKGDVCDTASAPMPPSMAVKPSDK